MSSAENSLRPSLLAAARSQPVTERKTAFLKFNPWLIPICVAGVIIVVADGATRALNLDMAEVAVEPLTYEPYRGALIFALVVLPLILFYARSAHTSKKEALLLWFVLCTVAYTKDFSYIGVPGTKLFVTEIVLGCLMLSQFGVLLRSLPALGKFTMLALIGFILAGVLAAARGVLAGQEKMLVARDSVIVLYAAFLPIGFLMISSWEHARRLFFFFALGGIFASLNAIAWFLAQPGQRRYVEYGPYLLIAIVGTIVLTINRQIRPFTGWLLTGLIFAGIILANARTIYATLGLALLLIVVVSPAGRIRLSTRLFKRMAAVSVVLVCVLWIFSRTKVGGDFVESAAGELVSGTVNYSDDPNAHFRFLAWLEALQRFSAQPHIGEGYGIPFEFELSNMDPRPHNTYLTVLYKMGLLGAVPLIAVLASFHWKGWKSLSMLKGDGNGLILYILLVSQLVMCAYGFLNLLLESPFLASIYWLMLGAGMRMAFLARSSGQARYEAAAA
jgi:O-antigen ligase